jgi:hypothetical protein
MKVKAAIFFFFSMFLLIIFSCSLENEKQMEMDEDGYYIVYKEKLPKNYWKYYNGKFRIFRLITDYGLRIDSDRNDNLKNIYLYDKFNGIEYIIKNINNLENTVINKLPSNITINYYVFCTGGSGVKNSHEIEQKIDSILENIKIKFIYYYDPDENYDYKLNKVVMDRCLGF